MNDWKKFDVSEFDEDARRKMVGVAMDHAMRHIDEVYDPSEKHQLLTILGSAINRPTAQLRFESVSEAVDMLDTYLAEQKQRYAPQDATS